MVVPYGDPYYYQNRHRHQPRRALAGGGRERRARSRRLLRLATRRWRRCCRSIKQGHLAAIQACGSPNASRSHFDSQDLMESGVDEDTSVQDGWLNRLLGCCPEDAREEDRLPRRLDDRDRFRAASRASRIRSPSAISIPSAWPATPSVTLAGPSGTANGFESMYGAAVDTVLHGTARGIVRRARSAQADAHGDLSRRPTARSIRRAPSAATSSRSRS